MLVAYIRACLHTYVCVYIHIYLYAYIPACRRAYICIMRTHMCLCHAHEYIFIRYMYTILCF